MVLERALVGANSGPAGAGLLPHTFTSRESEAPLGLCNAVYLFSYHSSEAPSVSIEGDQCFAQPT